MFFVALVGLMMLAPPCWSQVGSKFEEPTCVLPKLSTGVLVVIAPVVDDLQNLTALMPGTEVILFCNDGYEPYSNKTTRFYCQDDGVWSDDKEISCVSTEFNRTENFTMANCTVPSVENGTVTVYTWRGRAAANVTQVSPGARMRLTCNNTAGGHKNVFFQVVDGSDDSVCQPTGNWSSIIGKCDYLMETFETLENDSAPVEPGNETANSVDEISETDRQNAYSDHDGSIVSIFDCAFENNGRLDRPPQATEPVDFKRLNATGARVEAFLAAISSESYPTVVSLFNYMGPQLIEARNSFNETPLILAANAGSPHLVDFFLNKAADVEARDAGGLTALIVAAKKNAAPIVEQLLHLGANTEARDLSGRTSLHWASAHGYVESLELLLEHGADTGAIFKTISKGAPICSSLSSHIIAASGHLKALTFIFSKRPHLVELKNTNKETPLMCAAYHGQLNAVGRLVKRFNASVDEKSSNGETALFAAVRGRHFAVVKFLARNGADVRTKNVAQKTPLHLAVDRRAEQIARFIASEFPKTLEDANGDGNNPLCAAAELGNVEMLGAFTSVRPDLAGKPGHLGRTAIHAAARNGHVDAVRFLARKIGVEKIWAQSKAIDNGDMAIHQTIRGRHLGVVRLLLSLDGQQIEAQNLHGDTPLLLSTRIGDADIACFLVKNGSDKEITDSVGKTPLIIAAGFGFEQIVRCLVEAGANLTVRSSIVDGGITAIHAAAANGSIEVIKFLVTNVSRSLLESTDAGGATPLLSAVVAHRVEAVKVLLNLGADIEATMLKGIKTALWVASAMGNVEIVEFLVSKGANMEAVGEYGRTPLLAAAAAGHYNVTRFLVENGANWQAVSGIIDGRNTALHLAAAFDQTEVSRYLLETRPQLASVRNARNNTASQLESLLWSNNKGTNASPRRNKIAKKIK